MTTPEFNFFQHWYPLVLLVDLDPKYPKTITLLGMRLVIWKPKDQQHYQIFLDECPHRLAPLSEGRIDEKTGNLMCSYHGWEFNSQGVCTRIPQAENPELVKDKFCVQSFPTREQQEILWVWTDPLSPELAAKTPLALSPQIDAEKGFVWSSFFRELDYDWQTLVENLVDPSHVAFAHHGLQGRRENAQPITFELLQSTIQAIEATISVPGRTIKFHPPCHIEYQIEFPNGKKVGIVAYCIPVLPGKSRLIGFFPQNFAKTLVQLKPRWWDHIMLRNLVMDSDMMLLHQQERLLQQNHPNQTWKTAYKMPTSADRLIIEFRKWFEEYCHGQLPWKQLNIPVPEYSPVNDNRRQVMDIYHQHTQHCSSCRNALKNIQRLQLGLLIYFVLTVSTVALISDSLRSHWGFPLMAIALFGLGIYGGLKYYLEPKFYFIDYIHADKE
ncbi:aromatic ring-hydroxylating dioxygenase subunit alpha [Planktothrix mougeotii]|uniref:Rieske 2Fe-2S domain-containing protein n=1 Tax=Planktothrix mougeotii LEGE 06226 TaxID=1828728 RepID=A0ABR9UEK3_9CYAN|nr:Rieske 2Fe-2S domain-containing protein [Planktothrix mougeotii]MBE9144544.1 Rieske 2Fe-2S domain-containing protein [Planktothrix mougeotii LEGE 06226]